MLQVISNDRVQFIDPYDGSLQTGRIARTDHTYVNNSVCTVFLVQYDDPDKRLRHPIIRLEPTVRESA